MEERLETVEHELQSLRAEFIVFRNEAKTERAMLSQQLAVTDAKLTALIQQRDEREKAELKRESELKSGEIAKLQAEIRQRTILTAIQKADPILTLIVKGGAAALVIWAIFKYIVKNAN